MVETLRSIFETNRFILYAVYGQVFFVVGLATALQPRRHSRLPLASHLWWLASFGILQALAEWGHVFVPVQETYLPPSVTALLWTVQVVLLVLSFAALLQFGLALMGPRIRTPAVMGLPALLLALWVALAIALPADDHRSIAETLARYLLGLPGAALTAVGLLFQVQSVSRLRVERIASSLRWASISFAVFAVVGGLLVPPAPIFPATLLNTALVDQLTGVPVAVWRSLCGLGMAIMVVRSLEAFDVEMDRIVRAAAREQALAADRARISLELHDGLIQSLYAAGLSLEDALYMTREDPEATQEKLRSVIATLNHSISHIRRYILDLTTPEEGLDARLGHLVQEFMGPQGPEISFEVRGSCPQPLTSDQVRHLVHIAREALANAVAHSQAHSINLVVTYAGNGVRLEIVDDGQGFRPEDRAALPGHGLANLQERARELGAKFELHTVPGQGTRILVDAPIAGAAAT